jgi:CRP-like cAMP-binding protein
MATARAVEDSVLLTILSFSIKELAKKHPDIMAKIEDIIVLREFENKKIK